VAVRADDADPNTLDVANPVALNVAVPGDQHECRQHDPRAD